MKVLWTTRAKTRLKKIRNYIAEESPQIADEITYRIIQRTQKLAELPHIGRVVPEYHNDNLREILDRPYRIIYRLHSDQIHIISVIHYRQLLPDDLSLLK